VSSTATADLVIETRGLRKEFRGRGGTRVAVHDLDLSVPRGGVHGFLGPNGSGKTTTIRMLLGLARATRGEMALFGTPVPSGLPQVIDRVGAVVEMPKFLPHFTGRQNLTILARSKGIAPDRIDAAVDTVGLTGRDGDRYKAYSLGMKQRLAIAATLLKDPQLLILDEPTNGLDPAGIVEIRGLLRRLASDGRTVVVSSHLLSELEAICDHLVIIRFGEILFAGPMSEMLKRTRAHIDIATEHAADTERLAAALAGSGWQLAPVDEGIRVVAGADRAAELNRAAASTGVTLRRLVVAQDSLEELFLEMTGHSDGELAAARAVSDGRAA
jgi:ABC-2 type transport system ATP-binding protein